MVKIGELLILFLFVLELVKIESRELEIKI